MSAHHATLPAASAAPYLHADERALVLCDGSNTVVLDASWRRWAADTLDILLAEHRATRTRNDRTFGGFVSADGETATLYVADGHGAVSLTVAVAALRDLRGTQLNR